MRLLFVADGRSPTALNWLQYWIETGHETHLVSTFPCDPPAGLASFHMLPVAFGGMAGGGKGSSRPGLAGRFRTFLRPLRYILGPLGLPRDQARFRRLVDSLRPDLVHALRIPFEGMLAAATPPGIPLLVSIWGNDLTLHAPGSILMRQCTRRTLRRTDGLLADTQRDVRLAHAWGLAPGKPALVVPGSGGIRLDQIGSGRGSGSLPEELPEAPIVVNPRGQRPGSLRQDVFFQAIPLVLERVPQALFICPPLKGDADAEHWVDRLGIGARTKLWPRLRQGQLWALYKRSLLFVSPSVHDGTPNSMLEAMACGCFPVVGNIESMREWVTPGVNGLLVEADSPRSLADGILAALEDPALRKEARKENARLIAERADYRHCMEKAGEFFRKFV